MAAYKKCSSPPVNNSYLVFYIYNLTIKNSFMLTLKDNQNQKVGISGAADSKGAATTLSGITVHGDNDAAAKFSIDGDGKLDIASVAPGVANATVTGKDADGHDVTGTVAVTVIAQDATAIVFTPEAPTAQ